MRWNKALNGLLIIFIVLNVALGWMNYNRFNRFYRISDERIETIKGILAQRQIQVKADLPTLFMPRSSIWIEPMQITTTLRDQLVNRVFGKEREGVTITNETSSEYGKNALIYRQEEAELAFYKTFLTYRNGAKQQEEGVLSQKQASKFAKAFVKQLNLEDYLKEVKIDYRSESYGMEVTYYEVYRGLPIFDSFVKMKISPQGVFEAEVRCLEVTDKVSLTKPLYPIDQVLFALQKPIEENKAYVIESVELGYRLNYTEGVHILSEEATPMYKITIEGLSDPIFVNAYTNTYEEILFISQV